MRGYTPAFLAVLFLIGTCLFSIAQLPDLDPLRNEARAQREQAEAARREAEQARAAAAARQQQSRQVDEKLDKILEKLDRIDKRLTEIEKTLKGKPVPLEKKPAQAQGVKVRGIITFDGKPLDGATITLIPEDHSGKALPRSGTTQQGAFTIEGVQPGKYKVTIAKAGTDIPKQYADSKTSALRVEVGSMNATLDFSLRSR